jgi:hypothetical protein
VNDAAGDVQNHVAERREQFIYVDELLFVLYDYE